jgi:hypothetical protein
LNKTEEKEMEELLNRIRNIFKPISKKLVKNKKNLELIKKTLKLKENSLSIRFLLKVIFDENISKFQLDMSVKELEGWITELEFRISLRDKLKLTKYESYDRKIATAYYLQLISGFTDQEMKSYIDISNGKSPIDKIKGKKVSDKKFLKQFKELQKQQENYYHLDAFLEKKKIILNIEKIRIPTKLKKRAQKKIVETAQELDVYKKKLKELENKLETINNMKNTCTTCHQKMSKTYKKNQLKSIQNKIKTSKINIEVFEGILKAFQELHFASSDEQYLTYDEAKKYVNMLMIKSKKEWDEYAIMGNKLPQNIPKYPHITYRSSEENNDNQEWNSWSEWLGVKPIKKRSYEEAKKYVSKLGLKSSTEWDNYVMSGMLPADIPKHPKYHYEKEWESWTEFIRNSKSKKTKFN